MSSSFKVNSYRIAVGCRKLYFSRAGCRKHKKVWKHWSTPLGLDLGHIFSAISTKMISLQRIEHFS